MRKTVPGREPQKALAAAKAKQVGAQACRRAGAAAASAKLWAMPPCAAGAAAGASALSSESSQNMLTSSSGGTGCHSRGGVRHSARGLPVQRCAGARESALPAVLNPLPLAVGLGGDALTVLGCDVLPSLFPLGGVGDLVSNRHGAGEG
jgi:hypothetical protein